MNASVASPSTSSSSPSYASEIVAVLVAAKNVNAAIKKLLKLEGTQNPRAALFAKQAKEVLVSGNLSRIQKFVESTCNQYEGELLAIARYAHAETVDEMASAIVHKYSDSFNETYEYVEEDSIRIKDQKNFENIVAEAMKIVATEWQDRSLPVGRFIQLMMIYAIFDSAVAKEVRKLVKL